MQPVRPRRKRKTKNLQTAPPQIQTATKHGSSAPPDDLCPFTTQLKDGILDGRLILLLGSVSVPVSKQLKLQHSSGYGLSTCQGPRGGGLAGHPERPRLLCCELFGNVDPEPLLPVLISKVPCQLSKVWREVIHRLQRLQTLQLML